MSLLGIDVGTTGCKSAIFSISGGVLALAYEEYDHVNPQPGWAELDPVEVLDKTKRTIAKVAGIKGIEPVEALSVTSFGEAVVPVTKKRKVLGPSILNYCKRGEEYFDTLERSMSDGELYSISGNRLGTYFANAKMMWVRDHQPDLYKAADYFLPWTSFISFMLGAEPVVDFSLASRTLLFDINKETWSDALLEISGLDFEKLPETKQAGTVIGELSTKAAEELNLPEGIPIVIGAHDQCTNATGCGVIRDGQAMFSIGTFPCVTPVYSKRFDTQQMILIGTNTEHHAVTGKYVSLIYNQGGSVVKWFRDTFAKYEHLQAKEDGKDIYKKLFSEMPEEPGPLILLPYFSSTGLPDFTTNTSGVMTGLRLTTKRGEILKGIVESIIYDIRMTVDALNEVGCSINEFSAVGGGSKSDAWVQICADIFNRPMVRPRVTQSGALGAALIAGIGGGVFEDYESGVQAMVKQRDRFEPDEKKHYRYMHQYEKFLKLRGMTKKYLKELEQDK